MLELEKLLKSVLTKKKEERVGKVDMALINDFKENTNALRALEKKVKKEIDAFIEKIEAENDPKIQEFEQKRKLLWERVYDELNLSESERGEVYTVDHATGVVSKVIETPLFEGKNSNSNAEKSKEEPLN